MPRLPKAFYIKLGFYQQHPSHDLLYIIDYINCLAEVWEIPQKFTSSEKYILKKTLVPVEELLYGHQ